MHYQKQQQEHQPVPVLSAQQHLTFAIEHPHTHDVSRNIGQPTDGPAAVTMQNQAPVFLSNPRLQPDPNSVPIQPGAAYAEMLQNMEELQRMLDQLEAGNDRRRAQCDTKTRSGRDAVDPVSSKIDISSPAITQETPASSFQDLEEMSSPSAEQQESAGTSTSATTGVLPGAISCPCPSPSVNQLASEGAVTTSIPVPNPIDSSASEVITRSGTQLNPYFKETHPDLSAAGFKDSYIFWAANLRG